MKTLLITSVISFLLFGCVSKEEQEVFEKQRLEGIIRGIDTLNIDGCEYLFYRQHQYGAFLTHKGNCSNPIHKK